MFNFEQAATGLVEAYVCRKCDFTCLHAGVKATEPDGDVVRELHPSDGDGPFR